MPLFPLTVQDQMFQLVVEHPGLTSHQLGILAETTYGFKPERAVCALAPLVHSQKLSRHGTNRSRYTYTPFGSTLVPETFPTQKDIILKVVGDQPGITQEDLYQACTKQGMSRPSASTVTGRLVRDGRLVQEPFGHVFVYRRSDERAEPSKPALSERERVKALFDNVTLDDLLHPRPKQERPSEKRPSPVTVITTLLARLEESSRQVETLQAQLQAQALEIGQLRRQLDDQSLPEELAHRIKELGIAI